MVLIVFVHYKGSGSKESLASFYHVLFVAHALSLLATRSLRSFARRAAPHRILTQGRPRLLSQVVEAGSASCMSQCACVCVCSMQVSEVHMHHENVHTPTHKPRTPNCTPSPGDPPLHGSRTRLTTRVAHSLPFFAMCALASILRYVAIDYTGTHSLPFFATLLLTTRVSRFVAVHVMGPKEVIQVSSGTSSVVNRLNPGV